MKKSFAIAMSLAVVAFIGCGGGGGLSDVDSSDENTPKKPDTTVTNPPKVDNNSSALDAKIESEYEDATLKQETFAIHYSYYGYIKTLKGYNIEKNSITYSCEGIKYAGAEKRENSIFFATIDDKNETLGNLIPKIASKYILTTNKNETMETIELHFTEDEKYLVGIFNSYNEKVKKVCKKEIYLKKR